MTKVYFENGEYARHEGGGRVYSKYGSVRLLEDDFLLFGNIDDINNMYVVNGSLNAKDATITNNRLFVGITHSKAENINNAGRIWLKENSSLSNSSTNELQTSNGNNTIDGEVSAKVVKIYNSTLNIAKNGVLKVSDKNDLDFSKISGDGKIYDEKTHAYYDTNNKLIGDGIYINLSALNAGDGDESFSFDGTKLVLNKGYEFSLSGDKPVFIVNNGMILKADINGAKLTNINSNGSIKELHLSNNAHFNLNGDFEKAVIDKGSMLTLFKQVDFSKLSGEGLVNINGIIYDTSGHALNNAGNSFQENIVEYNAKIADAIEKVKAQKYSYVDKAQQEKNVELLNIEAVNSDALI